jgi:hypothetical protein
MTCPNLVDGAVQVHPTAGDSQVGLVDEPAVTAAVTASPGRVDQQRGKRLDPPVDVDVIDLDASLGQELLNVSVGEPVAQVPPDRQQDHVRGEAVPKKRGAV